MRGARFAVMRQWIDRCRPRLVIGTGLAHLADFLAVTGTDEMPAPHRFEVNGRPKRMHVATSGVVPLAVVPHLSGGPHGLNSNEAVRMAAEFVRPAITGEAVAA
ncbi:hypothetical protein ACFOD9_12210 [Novosphingobium bradum]|uniref:Uracil-DNA glycosylase-like domain-containing protein n=1 Tax=Novosphingobium bradum TaxID=1737444 RepID=A0ABV7IRT5_9SPHN